MSQLFVSWILSFCAIPAVHIGDWVKQTGPAESRQTGGKKRLIQQCRHSEVEKRLDTRTFQSHLNQSLNIQRMAAAWCRILVVVVLLMSLLGSTAAVGGAVSRPRPQRRPPKKPKVEPVDVTPPAPDIDIQQVRNWRHRQKSSTLCALSWCVFFSDNVIRHFL